MFGPSSPTRLFGWFRAPSTRSTFATVSANPRPSLATVRGPEIDVDRLVCSGAVVGGVERTGAAVELVRAARADQLVVAAVAEQDVVAAAAVDLVVAAEAADHVGAVGAAELSLPGVPVIVHGVISTDAGSVVITGPRPPGGTRLEPPPPP